jgi:hypothetical protein
MPAFQPLPDRERLLVGLKPRSQTSVTDPHRCRYTPEFEDGFVDLTLRLGATVARQ